ncbi:MAG: flagellar basal body L-ring protein FlgH [Deltaproteobacteria bacterium]|nr:flagellar basal body L-ring protein FlgH [Deltaproteobacteria bacterium]
MKKIIIIHLLITVMISGCAIRTRNMATEPTIPPPIAPAVKSIEAPPPVQRANGSLWTGENRRNMFFTDNKARYINDIVTIVIEESSSGRNKASTNTSRDTATNSGVSALLGLDTSLTKRNANLGGEISVGGKSSNSLKGSGDTSRGGTLSARVTARVVRILENGNLFIEGRRQLTLNEEDQYIVITGIVRPEDISSENLVMSYHIADARIVYTGTGVINDKQRPGWLTRVLDWGWPF